MNKKPDLKAEQSVARRLRYINYPFKFVQNPLLKHEKLIDLDAKTNILSTNMRNAFFQLLITFLKPLQINNYKIQIPPDVIEDTNEYLNECDKIKQFFNTYYIITDDKKDIIKVDDMFNKYRSSDYYDDIDKKSKNNFVIDINSLNIERKRRGINKIYSFINVKEKTDEQIKNEQKVDFEPIIKINPVEEIKEPIKQEEIKEPIKEPIKQEEIKEPIKEPIKQEEIKEPIKQEEIKEPIKQEEIKQEELNDEQIKEEIELTNEQIEEPIKKEIELTNEQIFLMSDNLKNEFKKKTEFSKMLLKMGKTNGQKEIKKLTLQAKTADEKTKFEIKKQKKLIGEFRLLVKKKNFMTSNTKNIAYTMKEF
jgi:hypothetical protein